MPRLSPELQRELPRGPPFGAERKSAFDRPETAWPGDKRQFPRFPMHGGGLAAIGRKLNALSDEMDDDEMEKLFRDAGL